MFGKKWAIIKESQKVFGIKTKNLLASKPSNEEKFFDYKQMKSVTYIDYNKKDENKKEISFKLPSSNSEVLDIQFLQDGSKDTLNLEKSETDNLIQIIAMDY